MSNPKSADIRSPILIVEDSPEDYEATTRALQSAGVTNPFVHCVDGDTALDYLLHRGTYSDSRLAPRPGIVLLDLNLPGTDGRTVLTEIKSNDQLKQIPVIVLTSSRDPSDIAACYRAGANSYIHKPVNLEGFIGSIQRLATYWLQDVDLPFEEH